MTARPRRQRFVAPASVDPPATHRALVRRGGRHVRGGARAGGRGRAGRGGAGAGAAAGEPREGGDGRGRRPGADRSRPAAARAAARRIGGRLEAHGFEAQVRGRLAWVRLDPADPRVRRRRPPRDADRRAGRARDHGAANVALDEALAEQDLLVIVTADPGGPARAARLERPAARSASCRCARSPAARAARSRAPASARRAPSGSCARPHDEARMRSAPARRRSCWSAGSRAS